MFKNLLLMLCLSIFCTIGATVSAAERQVSLGLAKTEASPEHKDLMEDLGLTGHATVYYNLTDRRNVDDPYGWVKSSYLDEGYAVVLVLIIDDGAPNLLRRIIDGQFDGKLSQLIQAMKEDGRRVVLRPFHEMDASWHPWGIHAKGNSPQLVAKAFVYLARMFREANAPVTIEANFNRRDGKGKVLGDADAYLHLLDPWVDMYSISTYDRCGTNVKETQPKSFADEFAPAYDKLMVFTQKPINVAESSTAGICQDRLPWFAAMLKDIDTRFTQVGMVTFFFGEVEAGEASNDVSIQWGFKTSEDRAMFRELVTPYAKKWRAESVKPAPQRPAFRAPWSVTGSIYSPLKETGNPAINPATGEEFGKSGMVGRLAFQQQLLWPVAAGFEVGPGVRAGLVASSNDSQWWNNYVAGAVTFGGYWRLPSKGGNWGNFFLELVAEHRHYTGPTPSRFKGGNEDLIGLRAGFTFGGDWTKH